MSVPSSEQPRRFIGEETAIQFYVSYDRPLPAFEVSRAIHSIGSQYEKFIRHRLGDSYDSERDKLHIDSVRPGSLDITFVPGVIAPLLPIISDVNNLKLFFETLKHLIEFFRLMPISSEKSDKTMNVDVRDCENVQGIVAPVASNLNNSAQINLVVNGDVNLNYVLDASAARRVLSAASATKIALGATESVPLENRMLVLEQTRDAEPKSIGRLSYDRGIIEELDKNSKPIFFDGDALDAKSEMIQGSFSPYNKVYVVDVDVMVSNSRVRAYRIKKLKAILDRE